MCHKARQKHSLHYLARKALVIKAHLSLSWLQACRISKGLFCGFFFFLHRCEIIFLHLRSTLRSHMHGIYTWPEWEHIQPYTAARCWALPAQGGLSACPWWCCTEPSSSASSSEKSFALPDVCMQYCVSESASPINASENVFSLYNPPSCPNDGLCHSCNIWVKSDRGVELDTHAIAHCSTVRKIQGGKPLLAKKWTLQANIAPAPSSLTVRSSCWGTTRF